jgi:predicted Zn-dependent protease
LEIADGGAGIGDSDEAMDTGHGGVAHELAHVVRRHGLQQLVSTVGPLVVLPELSNSRESFLGTQGAGSALLMHLEASRQFEEEADREGWGYLSKAGVDPRGMRRFLVRLSTEPQYREAELRVPEVLRSHPADERRLAVLEDLWQSSHRRSGFAPLPALPGGGVEDKAWHSGR